MPKITKHAEFLDTLRGMVTKEAEMPKATGKPGADTHPASVSDSTEHVNKNEQGKPENNPQEFKQEKGKDGPLHGKKAEEAPATEDKTKEAAALAKAAVPDTTKPEVAADAPNKVEQTVKKAEETPAATPPAPAENLKLAELGQQLLQAIKAAQEAEKTAEGPKATGKPGADTHPASVSDSTEHVNKNEQGRPEKNPQDFKQQKGKDAPLHAGKTAEVNQEELDKQASFELGRQFCRNFLMTKISSKEEVYKEAGRRDFETLIAQAAAELEAQEKSAKQAQVKQASTTENVYDTGMAEKQAEEAGAQAFYAMMKQAQDEYAAEQTKLAFEQKVAEIAKAKEAAEKRAAELEASLKAKEAEMQKKAEEEKQAQMFQAWSNYTVDQLMSRLQSETSR